MNPQEQLFDVIATRTGTAVDGPFRSLDAAADIANRMNIQAAQEGLPVQYVAQVRDFTLPPARTQR